MGRAGFTTSQYLANTSSSPTLPSTGTLAIWIAPGYALPNGADYNYLLMEKDASNYFGLWTWNNNYLYCGWYPNAENRIVLTSGWSLSKETWHLIIYDWISGGLSNLYIDGTSKGTRNPTTIFSGSPAKITVFRTGYTCNAVVAWPTVWSVVLSSDNRASLLAGADPTTIDHANMTWHYPLDGSSPETEHNGGASLTLYGNPPHWSNPPDLYPTGIRVSKANAYSVLTSPLGAAVSKASGYSVLEGDTKVAQVSQEVLFQDDTTAAQMAQEVLEVAVTPDSEASVKMAHETMEAIVAPDSEAAVKLGQFVIEVITYPDAQLVAQSAFEILVKPDDSQERVAQSAFEVLVHPTSQEIRVAQSAFEVLIKPSQDMGRVAHVAAEVVIENPPTVADTAQVAAEIVAANVARAVVSHTAVEAVIQKFNEAQVSHTAVEVVSLRRQTARVSHTAVEVVAPRAGASVAHTATEVVRSFRNWAFVSQVAAEAVISRTAGQAGDTHMTQMKLAVLEGGGGVVRVSQAAAGAVVRAAEDLRLSQVVRASAIRADEDLRISQVVRAAVIHRKRPDFWPALIRLLQQ